MVWWRADICGFVIGTVHELLDGSGMETPSLFLND